MYLALFMFAWIAVWVEFKRRDEVIIKLEKVEVRGRTHTHTQTV